MPRQFTISPAPFKSSYLAIPPSPFSPRLPITPVAAPVKPITNTIHHTAQLKATADLLPPPAEPLPWIWQCHRCKRVYTLGVTRRCLDDGHFFCAGSTVIKRSKKNNYKKVVRHQACASEFDYQGWKAWGSWRKGVGEQVEAARALLRAEEGLRGGWGSEGAKGAQQKKDCWNECFYPSECTWNKRFGGSIPTAGAAATVVPSTEKKEDKKAVESVALPNEEDITDTPPATSFDDILLSITDPSSTDYLEPLSTTPASSQNPNPNTTTTPLEPDTAAPSMDDLLESAKRRKRRSSGQIPLVPSPLGANPPSPLEDEEKPAVAAGVVLKKSASSSALLESIEKEVEREAKRRSGGEGALGEWREKAEELVRSFREVRGRLGG